MFDIASPLLGQGRGSGRSCLPADSKPFVLNGNHQLLAVADGVADGAMAARHRRHSERKHFLDKSKARNLHLRGGCHWPVAGRNVAVEGHLFINVCLVLCLEEILANSILGLLVALQLHIYVVIFFSVHVRDVARGQRGDRAHLDGVLLFPVVGKLEDPTRARG